MAAAKLWSSVGSAGTVNPPDAGKVVLVGSRVQLGGLGGAVNPSPGAAVRERGPETQAVIRYNVTAVDGVFNPSPNFLAVALGVLCRRGNGQITARLVQVSIPPQQDRLNSVVETTLAEFQSQQPFADLFAYESPTLGNFYGVFDFETNAYYVELVLTASGNVVSEYPPAVSVIQVIYGTT